MSKDIQKTDKTTAVAQRGTGTPRGYSDNVSPKDLVLPRVELLQALSPAVTRGDGKAGQIVNSVSKEQLGEKVVFIPIKVEKNFIRWFPRAEGGGIMYRTHDPEDPRVVEDTKWQGKEKPKCTAYLNFLCMVEGQMMPLVISFSMTSYTAGRTLLTLSKTVGGGGDLFANKYALTAKQRTNTYGTFYVFHVDLVGPASDEEYNMAESIYKAFEQTEVQFDQTSEDPAAANDAAPAPQEF